MDLYYGTLLPTFSKKVSKENALKLRVLLQKFVDENREGLINSWLCLNWNQSFMGFSMKGEWSYGKGEPRWLLGFEEYIKKSVPTKIQRNYFKIMIKIYNFCLEQGKNDENFKFLAESTIFPGFFIVHQLG